MRLLLLRVHVVEICDSCIRLLGKKGLRYLFSTRSDKDLALWGAASYIAERGLTGTEGLLDKKGLNIFLTSGSGAMGCRLLHG
jgi:hypothetical protein